MHLLLCSYSIEPYASATPPSDDESTPVVPGATSKSPSPSTSATGSTSSCTAAAATLESEAAGALDHVVAGHISAEAAHGAVLAQLGKEPLLSLGMRLGEGSGAAVAINILKSAVACHSGMATFSEAGVSTA